MSTVDRASRASWVTMLFCFLAALCEGFDVQTAGVAAVGIRHELHPVAGQLGLFFSASNVGLMLGALVGGRLADRLGRKTVLVASIAAFGVFSLITSFAWNMQSLTWMRVLTGLGLGGAMPNLIVLATELSRASARNASIATTYIGMPLGGALASLIVALSPVEHWRWVFVSGGVVPLVIAAAMAGLMPESAALRRAGREPDMTPTRNSFLRDLFGGERLRGTLVLWSGFFLLGLTLHLMLNWLPLLLQGRGLSKTAAAFAQVGFNGGGAGVALLIGILLDSPWRRAGIAVTAAALPVILLSLANAMAGNAMMFGLALLLGGAILSGQVILYGAAGTLYPVAVRGTGTGAAVSLGRVGAIVGPGLAALLIGAGRTPSQVLTGILPIVVVCGVCVAGLGWRHSENELVRAS